VRVGEAQAEVLGVFGEPAQVAAAVEKVVDELPELPPGGFFLAYGETLRAFVALGGAGGVGPGCAGGGEVRGDDVAQSVAGVGGLFAQGASGLDLLASEAAAGGGDVRQELGHSRLGTAVQLLRTAQVFRAPSPHPFAP